MLPLYSGSSSNKYGYPSSTPRGTGRIAKKWKKTYKNFLHHTKFSSYVIVGVLILLTLFIIVSIASLSSSTTPFGSYEPVPTTQPEILKPDDNKDQVNINIVEDKNKEVKVLEDTPVVNVPNTAVERRNKIREAFIHAYGGYERLAFGYDELRPGN